MVGSLIKLEDLHQINVYRRHFMDVALWEPFVRQVCAAHELVCDSVGTGLAGTCPTFVVDARWVVKFFGKLFDGAAAFMAELAANRLVVQEPMIPAAPLIAFGELLPQDAVWHWPYLVFEFLPGGSIGEQVEAGSLVELEKVACWIGQVIRPLHHLALTSQSHFPASWKPFTAFLQQQVDNCVDTHRRWGTLPAHLITQIPDFMLSVTDLLDEDIVPHLIHADLTADHLLGVVENGRFCPTGLIDFGDAMVGNILYELVAVHIDMFRCSKRLLSAFLNSYELPGSYRDNFAAKAMCMTLLHRFDVMVGAVPHLPPVNEIESLGHLADLLWQSG